MEEEEGWEEEDEATNALEFWEEEWVEEDCGWNCESIRNQQSNATCPETPQIWLIRPDWPFLFEKNLLCPWLWVENLPPLPRF